MSADIYAPFLHTPEDVKKLQDETEMTVVVSRKGARLEPRGAFTPLIDDEARRAACQA
ncbi:MAG: hypothetical protein KKH74_06305 [Gammaproteobacteria bacterium]|nr:hypothetical protein [Gammaproteobacteria bacterium]MBU1732255.1 hypothetical protein [Gammaproteobacteria bacterium]MBU1893825.1 hypothetical protein [Gammaproteobacteria bacterium]